MQFALDLRKEEERIKLKLTDCGFLPFLKGYDYTLTACLMALRDNNPVIDGCRIYPMVAACYYTTPARVDRAIRHAIELAWSWENGKSLKTVYPGACPPSNTELISFLCAQIRT